jgi:N utilization substance protein A
MTMIPAALQPATIDEVLIYPRVGRAIVIVKDDQLSLAIGKGGRNVRLASKLCGIDIEIMTVEELDAAIEKAKTDLVETPYLDEEMVEALIEEGILTFDDLSVTEPDTLMEIAGLEERQALEILDFAEEKAEEKPDEPTSRSSMLGSTGGRSAAQRAAEELLGPMEVERKPEVEKKPTAAELFGDTEIKPDRERKITAEDLFRKLDDEQKNRSDS